MTIHSYAPDINNESELKTFRRLMWAAAAEFVLL